MGARTIFFVMLAAFLASVAQAQTNRSPHWDVGATIGTLLPENYADFNETLPYWSAQISKGIYSFRPELSFGAGKAKGLEYQIASLALRNSLGLDALGAFWLVGASLFRYQPEHRSYQQDGSLELGAGCLLKILGPARLRADFLFNAGYAHLVVVDVGFTFVLDDDSTSTAGG